MQRPDPPDPRTQRLRARGLLLPRSGAPHTIGTVARERVRNASKAQAIGAPLARRLPRQRSSAHLIALSRAVAAAGVAWFSGGMLIALAAALAAYLAGYWFARKRAVAANPPETSDLALAREFDRVLTAASPQLPDESVALLARSKTALTHLLPNLSPAQNAGVLSADDVFFVRESVARYVPQAIDAFLALPPTERGRVRTEFGASAREALQRQLEQIASQLAQTEQRLLDAQAREVFHAQQLIARKLDSSGPR